MKSILHFFFFATCFFGSASGDEQSLGLWLAGDEDKPYRSIIELFVENQKMSGRIERVIDQKGREVNVVCDGCPGEIEGKPMKGLIFISGLTESEGRWIDGQVVNLEPGLLRGVLGRCELAFINGNVEFYGYGKIFGQKVGKRLTWTPYTKQ